MILRPITMVVAGLACLTTGGAATAIGSPSDSPSSATSASARTVHRPAGLRVGDVARLGEGGWRVEWTVRVRCPRGRAVIGRALIAERDPVAIPALAGEDQGITAVLDLDGARRCTGGWQRLRLMLRVRDTVVSDPATGTSRTYHEPLHPTPPWRTTAALELRSPEEVEDGGFQVGFCAAPNCAEETGPRITLR